MVQLLRLFAPSLFAVEQEAVFIGHDLQFLVMPANILEQIGIGNGCGQLSGQDFQRIAFVGIVPLRVVVFGYVEHAKGGLASQNGDVELLGFGVGVLVYGRLPHQRGHVRITGGATGDKG